MHAPSDGEVIHRPAPGLARGVWEAPPWLFYAVIGAAIFALVSFALYKAGVLRRSPPTRDPR